MSALGAVSALPGVAAELGDARMREILVEAVEGVDAARLRQQDRDTLCDACDVLGLKAPPR